MSGISTRRRAPRILVVDDSPEMIAAMREMLAARDYEVVAAADAWEGEVEIERQHPDLILSDVVMPGKSGFDFCRELKDDPATRLIPLILITGLSNHEDRLRGIDAGADDFLSKPFVAEQLFARIKSLLKLKQFTDDLENAEAILCSLGLSVESRDPYTEGHCERLAQNASSLGRHLGLDSESVVALRRGGFLHDLGKIAIPDEILRKGADLTSAEWAIMKVHPLAGETICRPLKSLRLVLPIIRNHHEHQDGNGYPDGLRGDEIPLLARILQVVDVYDALRTARPYKPARTHEQAAHTMRQEAKTGLWDGELVGEFFNMLMRQRRVA